MTYTIRDNNGNEIFSIENTIPIIPEVSFESIDSSLKDLTEYSNKLNKSIEAYNLISDTRAMEALGYVKGAGFGKNIVNVSKYIWKKIKELFGKIKKAFDDLGKWVIRIFNRIKAHFNKNKVKEGAEVLSEACKGSKSTDDIVEKIFLLEDNREKTKRYNDKMNADREKLEKEKLEKEIKQRKEKAKRTLNDKLEYLLASPDFIEWTIHRSERDKLSTWSDGTSDMADMNDINYCTDNDIEMISDCVFDKNKTKEDIERDEKFLGQVNNRLKKAIDDYNAIKGKSTMSDEDIIDEVRMILSGASYSIANINEIQRTANYVIERAISASDNFIKLADKLTKCETDFNKELVLESINYRQQYLKIYITIVKAEVHSISMIMPIILFIADIPRYFYDINKE